MNGEQPASPLRELPLDELLSPAQIAREEAERVEAQAQQVAAEAEAQAQSDAELVELLGQLRALPALLIARYPGASAIADLAPEDRARLAGALRKHLARFRENIERDADAPA